MKISIAILAACASTLALTTAYAQTGSPYLNAPPLTSGTKIAPAPTGANPNDAAINTTRSNNKHPSVAEQPVGAKQEPSKAPLPPGYAYDANGRIGFVGGTDAGGKTGTDDFHTRGRYSAGTVRGKD